MKFEEFKEIVDTIKDHDIFCRKFSEFLESEICKQSFCYVTIGEKVVKSLIKMLCREFNAPTDDIGIGNEIDWWLYDSSSKLITMPDGRELDVSDIRDFYDYLMSEYKNKPNVAGNHD